MTESFAGLLAQLVPVVAVVLGLEFRQLASAAVQEIDALRVDLALRIHFLITLGVMAASLLGLAVLENASIAVIAQDDATSWWTLGLYGTVIIAFAAPVVDLGHRLIGAFVRNPRWRVVSLTVVLAGIPGLLLAATVAVIL